MESGSDLYTHNLIEHFEGDLELQAWLREHWEHEELQHGRALAAYVQHVWPEFDWHAGFQAFWKDYGALCTNEQLEPSRGLELAARCVVETGTASLYRALNDIVDEPVLKQLTNHIKSDEVRHYKHFYQAFLRYREQEGLGRYKVFRAILRRVNEIRNEDSDIALRHVFNQCYPHYKDDKVQFQKVAGPAQALLRRHIPAEMTVKNAAQAAEPAPPATAKPGKTASPYQRKVVLALSRPRLPGTLAFMADRSLVKAMRGLRSEAAYRPRVGLAVPPSGERDRSAGS